MYIDLLLLFLVISFIIIGYLQGFVHQAIGLIALFAIIFLAEPVSRWLQNHSNLELIQESPSFVLFLLISIGILALGTLLRLVFSNLKKTPVLGPIDRISGAVCGAAKAVVLALLVGIGFHMLPERVLLGFDDLNRDISRSETVKASFSILHWDRFETLQELRARFHSELGAAEEGGPWYWESDVDRR